MFPLSHFKASKLPTYLHQADKTSAYALVTGATDGIGLGFAQELLASGFNVILHGRNPEKLQRVRSDLQSEHPNAQIHTVQADAANFTQSDIARLTKEVESIPNMNLSILINNVGGAGPTRANFQSFEMHTPEEIMALVNLNILFTVQLTHALLPLLKAHDTKSLIMNVGSQAHAGIPYLSVYGATKGFIHTFSRSLAIEMAPYAGNEPIEVLEILVGSVQTQQNQTAKPTLMVPAARTVARSALNRVGCGEKHGVAAYWPHACQQVVLRLMPAGIVERVLVSALKGVVGKEERVW